MHKEKSKIKAITGVFTEKEAELIREITKDVNISDSEFVRYAVISKILEIKHYCQPEPEEIKVYIKAQAGAFLNWSYQEEREIQTFLLNLRENMKKTILKGGEENE